MSTADKYRVVYRPPDATWVRTYEMDVYSGHADDPVNWGEVLQAVADELHHGQGMVDVRVERRLPTEWHEIPDRRTDPK